MTLEAIVARAGKVLANRDVRDLAALRSSRAHIMTFIAAHALPRAMIVMPENVSEIVFRRGCPVVSTQSMTGAAGRPYFAIGGMAGITVCMGLKSDRYGLTRPGRSVTGRAALGRAAGAIVVIAVIELHVEPLLKPRRKLKHIRWRRSVTYRAHDLVFVHQLLVSELI